MRGETPLPSSGIASRTLRMNSSDRLALMRVMLSESADLSSGESAANSDGWIA